MPSDVVLEPRTRATLWLFSSSLRAFVTLAPKFQNPRFACLHRSLVISLNLGIMGFDLSVVPS